MIKNILIKYIPNVRTYYNSIKQSMKAGIIAKDVAKNLNKQLQENIESAQINMNNGLAIITNQKYKNILRNRGLSPCFPLILIWYLILEAFISFIFSLFYLIPSINKLSTSEVYNEIIMVGFMVINILDFTILPYLITLNIQRSTFFYYEES